MVSSKQALFFQFTGRRTSILKEELQAHKDLCYKNEHRMKTGWGMRKRRKKERHTPSRWGTKEKYHQIKILGKLEQYVIWLIWMICCDFIRFLMTIGCVLLGNSIDVSKNKEGSYSKKKRGEKICVALCSLCSPLVHMDQAKCWHI